MPGHRYELPALQAAPDVRLCLLDVKDLLDPETFEKALADVSPGRAAKAIRFRFPAGRALSLGAGIALDILLREHGLREKDMQYGLGENEKPYFIQAPDLRFNLSHSGSLVLACMGGRELGCDIQEEEKENLSIARHFFHPDETAWLSGLSDEQARKEAFYRLWVCKESFIKTLGTGLATDLSSFCVPLWEEGRKGEARRVTGREGEVCLLSELPIPISGYRGAVGLLSEYPHERN